MATTHNKGQVKEIELEDNGLGEKVKYLNQSGEMVTDRMELEKYFEKANSNKPLSIKIIDYATIRKS